MSTARYSKRFAVIVLMLGLAGSLYVANKVERKWSERRIPCATYLTGDGKLTARIHGEETLIEQAVPYAESPLRREALVEMAGGPPLASQWVFEEELENGRPTRSYSLLEPNFHFGVWSLMPAVVAIALCVATREALFALLSGVVVGAFMLGRYDLTDDVFLPNLGSPSAASIILLYLWLLGGLLGIWSRTGAAQAFAEFMTQHFVKGPRSAMFVSWLMGVLFFQGGTISVVLVGTIVKPVADREKISHEELAYIVDSTASPVASILAFNAWPIYVQAFIYVPGVAFLATEADRIAFFFSSVPFYFYSILAVFGTLLLSLGITRFSGPGIRAAQRRARATGQLDAPDAKALKAKDLQVCKIPEGYRAHVLEFILPVALMIITVVGTFLWLGTPKVYWAFGLALLMSVLMALLKGMKLGDLIEGIGDGLKGVVLGSVILLLAVTIGEIGREIGAGTYLVDLLGKKMPYLALPVTLLILTMAISFSTGTSMGTYAITLPLAMPLAWTVAQANGLSNPSLFMSVCFATVLNGSVFGDQCSPISDTTILSSMVTGCDLTDHVKSQLYPALYAVTLAAILWSATVAFFA